MKPQVEVIAGAVVVRTAHQVTIYSEQALQARARQIPQDPWWRLLLESLTNPAPVVESEQSTNE